MCSTTSVLQLNSCTLLGLAAKSARWALLHMDAWMHCPKTYRVSSEHAKGCYWRNGVQLSA